MEGRYPPAVYISLTDCKEPAREAEFNRWYDGTLVPALEGLGFLKNSRRYRNLYADEGTFRGRPAYLAVHELHAADPKAALAAIHKCEAEVAAKSPVAQTMLTKVNTAYRRAGPEFRSKRSGPVKLVYCGLVGPSDLSKMAEFDRWYNERHSPDALNAGLFDIGYRYDIVDPHDPLPHLSSPNLSLYETSIDIVELQPKLEAFRKEMIAVDPLWVDLLSIWYNGLFRPMQ